MASHQHAALCEARLCGGGVCAADLAARLRGADARRRADAALDALVLDGFAWVDDQAPERAFYFPSTWLDARQKAAAAAGDEGS